ncbi:hypothetical protein BASA81_004770 [Batrachochytrium salamandrivorans]|nr:hypothetical protein BASA81_004770 [Batrachochytrium salamandrivorans]
MFSCFQSAEAKRNSQISRKMKDDQHELLNTISVLILGPGDCGKTTLRKQIVSVHGDLFEHESHRITFCKIILGNLIDGVIEVWSSLNRTQEIAVLKARARDIDRELPLDLAKQLMETIYLDETFTLALKERNIQLQDCFSTFARELQSYPKWGGPGWVPSTDNCVRARVRTSGVVKDEIMINNTKFILYDVGGQRAERRKWMHSFSICSAAIYCSAISEYDQVMFEDRTKNRLQESTELFYECVNSSWLAKTQMILFLNKKDLFHEKFTMQHIPINISGLFPNAPTDYENEDAAIAWFADLFVSQKVVSQPQTKIFCHVTTATDPSNVKAVFQICTNVVLKQNMTRAGFVA